MIYHSKTINVLFGDFLLKLQLNLTAMLDELDTIKITPLHLFLSYYILKSLQVTRAIKGYQVLIAPALKALNKTFDFLT